MPSPTTTLMLSSPTALHGEGLLHGMEHRSGRPEAETQKRWPSPPAPMPTAACPPTHLHTASPARPSPSPGPRRLWPTPQQSPCPCPSSRMCWRISLRSMRNGHGKRPPWRCQVEAWRRRVPTRPIPPRSDHLFETSSHSISYCATTCPRSPHSGNQSPIERAYHCGGAIFDSCDSVTIHGASTGQAGVGTLVVVASSGAHAANALNRRSSWTGGAAGDDAHARQPWRGMHTRTHSTAAGCMEHPAGGQQRATAVRPERRGHAARWAVAARNRRRSGGSCPIARSLHRAPLLPGLHAHTPLTPLEPPPPQKSSSRCALQLPPAAPAPQPRPSGLGLCRGCRDGRAWRGWPAGSRRGQSAAAGSPSVDSCRPHSCSLLRSPCSHGLPGLLDRRVGGQPQAGQSADR